MHCDIDKDVFGVCLRRRLAFLGQEFINLGSQWIKGYLEGLVVTLEMIFSTPHVKEEIIKALPDKLPVTYLPPKWFLYPDDDTLTLDFTNIASFDKLMYELKMSNRFSEEDLDNIRPQLRHRYLSVIASMQSYSRGVEPKNIRATLMTPKIAGDQLICDWALSDIGKRKGESYNWHGQNTSQWMTAGCILIDARDKSVSIHT